MHTKEGTAILSFCIFLIAWSALVFLETMKNRDVVAKQWIAKANLMSNI